MGQDSSCGLSAQAAAADKSVPIAICLVLRIVTFEGMLSRVYILRGTRVPKLGVVVTPRYYLGKYPGISRVLLLQQYIRHVQVPN